MKKILFFVLILSFIVTGCQSNEVTSKKKPVNKSEHKNVPDYTPTAEDIVDKLGNLANQDKFFSFINSVKKGENDKIRVVRYTIEGDPILHDLLYDGKVIKSTIDSMRDKFGSGSINTTNCESIDIKESNDSTDYNLSGCEDSNRDNTILVIRK